MDDLEYIARQNAALGQIEKSPTTNPYEDDQKLLEQIYDRERHESDLARTEAYNFESRANGVGFILKGLGIAAIGVAALIFAGKVSAQEVRNDNSATSGSSSGAEAGAINQGVNLNAQFNSTTPDKTKVTYDGKVGNTPVVLTAATSFSSDFCGSVNSGGASGGGFTLGLSKTVMDRNCQALRRAEKFGMAASNAYNAGLKADAMKLVHMQVYEICTAGQDGNNHGTLDACKGLGLVVDQPEKR